MNVGMKFVIQHLILIMVWVNVCWVQAGAIYCTYTISWHCSFMVNASLVSYV